MADSTTGNGRMAEMGITVQDAARRLNVPRSTIHRWVDSGRVKAVTQGSRGRGNGMRLRLSDVQRELHRRAQEMHAQARKLEMGARELAQATGPSRAGPDQSRQEAVRRGYGLLAGVDSVDAFLRDRREELALEDRPLTETESRAVAPADARIQGKLSST